jgi:hypothetical protein
MDGLVATAKTDTPTIFSSITDAEGFTVVSGRGGTSSSPPKQRLQIRSPPHLRGEGARVNHFDEKFLNTFHVPGAPALETDGTLNIVTNQHNNDQPSSPLSLSLVPQPLIPPPLVHLATLPPILQPLVLSALQKGLPRHECRQYCHCCILCQKPFSLKGG